MVSVSAELTINTSNERPECRHGRRSVPGDAVGRTLAKPLPPLTGHGSRGMVWRRIPAQVQACAGPELAAAAPTAAA